ncbi:MAG TPA: glycosyltransferase family 4 protein [Candidatus Saccharimonadales bacterium]
MTYRIALIGPAHPYKGGIVHHTTELAHRLEHEGHDVSLLSWSAQYPSFLYPGEQRAPNDKPDVAPFANTSYPLSWKNPAGWLKVGRQLRSCDVVIIVFASSVQAPAYLAMLRARGKCPGRVVALCHNVLPHERRFFDKPLIRAVLSRVDQVLVHTPEQAQLAKTLTKAHITTAQIPPHLPAKPQGRHSTQLTRQLLFFGLVRPYKGVDVLLRALAAVPDVHATIGGEIWGGREQYDKLVSELGLQDRVTLTNGYVPSQDLPNLLAKADVLVLPYRSGTATQNITLAHAHGLPVIATKIGSMASQVREGIDGLLCAPDDVNSLAKAIKRFYEPGVAARLQKGIPPFSEDEQWGTYIASLLAEM